MRIRPATNADAEAVRRLVDRVLEEYGLRPDPEGTDADMQDLEGHYMRPGGLFEVVEDETGAIVGTVGLYRVDDQTVELRKMYLAPEARGKGLGRRLLERAMDEARAGGFKRMELETASVLKEAVALYERYGFEPRQAEHVASRCDAAYVLEL